MRWNQFQSYLWSLLLGGWLMMACSPSDDQRPDSLIPEERMAAILTEVHLAETRVSRLGLRSADSSNIVYKHLENQIFKKFQVDTASYRKSYIFYSSHPQQMETIYKQVTENLKKKAEAKKPARS
ncbi:DUF4296 domain-containing protein [Spirosoma soli]|uniref:DUF4296 domain-containing protein n=1 Tax=Spirosoma soli TaxID=1770529 RepID=A0ABW5M464_9BACT